MSIPGCPFDCLYRLLTTHSLFCVLCTQCFLYLRIVHFWLPLRFSLSFTYYPQSVLCLVYSMLSISKDCPFLVAPSIFSIVYLLPTVCSVYCVLNVAYIPGLSILGWPFDCLCRLFTIYSLLCVLCTQCYIYPMTVLYCLPLRLSLSFIYYLQFVLCLVFSILHISHDCPLLLGSSNISIVYLLPTVCSVSCVLNVTYILGLSFIAWLFEYLYRLFITHRLFCVLCTQCCLYLRSVHSWLPLRMSLSFIYYLQSVLCLVYSVFHISQDCSLLLASSVSGLSCIAATSVPGLSFIACLFGPRIVRCCLPLRLQDCPLLLASSVPGLSFIAASSVLSNVYILLFNNWKSKISKTYHVYHKM